MFRILDEKHIIMGDAKEDNMILFIKFDPEDEDEDNQEINQGSDANQNQNLEGNQNK